MTTGNGIQWQRMKNVFKWTTSNTQERRRERQGTEEENYKKQHAKQRKTGHGYRLYFLQFCVYTFDFYLPVLPIIVAIAELAIKFLRVPMYILFSG